MHEATIAKFILENAKQICQRKIAKLGIEVGSGTCFRIMTINLRVGEFRNVEIDSLVFAFDALKRDEPLTEKASLEIELMQMVALCKNGHRYTPVPEQFYACPACNQGMESVLEGKELEITCVKLEELDNAALESEVEINKG